MICWFVCLLMMSESMFCSWFVSDLTLVGVVLCCGVMVVLSVWMLVSSGLVFRVWVVFWVRVVCLVASVFCLVVRSTVASWVREWVILKILL